MICWLCDKRKATEQHHALITKAMARGCSKELQDHIENVLNKIPVCQRCHTGRGHVSRREIKAVMLRHRVTEKAIECFFDEADKLVKIPFTRI